jgi:XTP/dITP diphosphohydrolase/tetrapyrrole methylase family protein/MazG family protein/ATP diphosphatase
MIDSGRDGLAAALLDLHELAAKLRRDCPWDRAQTAGTIVPHTVEEAYEVADAALAGDDDKLLDELGDLLFQAVFLALLLEEKGTGDLAEVARRIHEKLVRRHPHVFGSPGELHTPGEVKHRWESLKTEQEGREGVFHDVPEGLPALLYAQKTQRRAATTGFDWLDAAGPLAKVREEIAELEQELTQTESATPETEPDPRVASEVGDLLFSAVNLARRLNVDPELALRQTTRRFVGRVERAVELAAGDGASWTALPLADQDRYYSRAKRDEQR